MMSFVTRGRNLPVQIGRVLISDCYSPVKRNFISKSYIHSSCICYQNVKTFNVENYRSQKLPEDFGKIVDVEQGFDQVRVSKRPKRRGKVKEADIPLVEASEESSVNIEPVKKDYFEKKFIKSEGTTSSYKAVDQNVIKLNKIMTCDSSKNSKRSKDSIVIEGKRLIQDACAAGLIPKMVFFTRASHIDDLNLPKETKLLRVPYKVCQLWSKTETCQGIIGVFDKFAAKNLKIENDPMPLTVICDNIRDPGNLGSILRVAAGAGCKELVLTPGCVDVWGPKVLRAGAGAHFRLPLFKNLHWINIEEEINEESEVFLAEGNSCGETITNSEKVSKFSNRSMLIKDIPVISCFSLGFKNKSTVLIIGGETHGISEEAYEFAKKRNGTRVFIPMENKVESLNTSVALGILTYEFKRQFSSMSQDDSHLLEKIETGN